MLAVVIVCVVVIVALVVAHLRQRRRIDTLTIELSETAAARDRAEAAEEEARAAANVTSLERDDALERVQRARRDAAEVANRLRDETAARTATETELEQVRADLAEARAAGPGGVADVLWALSLRQTEHLWRLSVAVDPSSPSPIDGADDPFRAAIEVEVDAAREESGADVELVWKGTATPSPERAVVALAVVRDVIATLGTSAATTTVTVDSGDDGIEVTISASDDDDHPLATGLPPTLEVDPGKVRIA